MITTHLVIFSFFNGASGVAGQLPPWPETALAATATPATRNRRRATFPDIGTLQLRTDRLTGSAEARLRAPASLSASYDLVMPSNLPADSQSLYVNSSGQMSFQGWRQTIADFFQDNLAASQASTAMSRFSSGGAKTEWLAPRAGSVTAIAIRTNDARTAGSATAELYKNGAAQNLTAVLDATNTTFKATTADPEVYTFLAGDRLELRLESSGWAPTTADLQGSIEVET